MVTSQLRAFGVAVVLAGSACWTGQAQTFTRIVDTATSVPGTESHFEFFDAPAFDGAAIGFFGRGGIVEGIFSTAGGTLHTVVDRNTLMPGQTVNFAFFGGPAVEDGVCVFSGVGAGQWRGIYTGTASTLETVADRATTVPGFDFPFFNFTGFGASGQRIVFRGQGGFGASDGIYETTAAGLAPVADTTTMIPDGAKAFSAFGPAPDVDGDDVVFRGVGSSGELIIARLGGTLTRVADFFTPIPNDPNGATFSFFDGPTIAGGSVAFIGGDEVSIISIAGYEGGRLGTIADTLTLVPDGAGFFLGFSSAIALGPAGVAIQGFGDGQNGIYSTLAGGGLSRVLAVGDMLDGHIVTDLLLGRDGLRDTSLVFVVHFDDDTSAIYRADFGNEPCQGDVDGDGQVGLSDLATLLAHFGLSEGATLAEGDIDGDGDVDLTDLAELLANFGAACP